MKKNENLKEEIQVDETCHCNEGEECTCEDESCHCGDDCECEECDCDKEEDNQNIDESQEALALGERIGFLKDQLLRNQAELQNYKKRKDEETSRILKYANEDIILEFLPILDSFERAIDMDDANYGDEVSKFLEGFKMIYNSIKNTLSNYGVNEIEALDKEFDPSYHQAVMTGKKENIKPGIVIEVLQKGYIYKDKVIRPSMVKVNE